MAGALPPKLIRHLPVRQSTSVPTAQYAEPSGSIDVASPPLADDPAFPKGCQCRSELLIWAARFEMGLLGGPSWKGGPCDENCLDHYVLGR